MSGRGLRWLGSTATSVLLLGSCARPATQLVVVTNSDLAPADRGCVVIEARPLDVDEVTANASLDAPDVPFSFGVTPPGGQVSRNIELSVSAFVSCAEAEEPSATPVVSRRVRAGFIAEQSLRLDVFLGARCRGVVCSADQTCEPASGLCEDVPLVDPQSLTRITPGDELDGAVAPDAGGVLDASTPDAATPDGGADAGTPDSGIADGGIADAGVSGPCASGMGEVCWSDQIGTSATDVVNSIAVDSAGYVLVGGTTGGPLPGQMAVGADDVFLRKYDLAGTPIWTDQFGTDTSDKCTAISVDADGNVLVGGLTYGTLPGATQAGSADAFVRKYDADGTMLWTDQFGTSASDAVQALGVDADGNVFVAGTTLGSLAGTSLGDNDIFVRKYGPDGTVLWTRQLGTEEFDLAVGVTVGAGGVLVAGSVGAALPGQSSGGSSDAFVRAYGTDGEVSWTLQFGTSGIDTARSVGVDSDGNVVIVGDTTGTLGSGSSGNVDAFVRKYDASRTPLWTRQFGTSGQDNATSVNVDAHGDVLVGGTVAGALTSEGPGGRDAYVRRYDSAGAEIWTRQLGTDGDDVGNSLSRDAFGDVLLAGYVDGTLPGESSAGNFDGFVLMLSP